MIVVDTHVLVWALNDDRRLGPRSRDAIVAASGDGGVRVSAITPWEIAILVQKGRLALGRDVLAWIETALGRPGVALTPIAPAIAVDSVRLPGDFHADPADRIIIATARSLACTLVTADHAILNYGQSGHVHAMDATQ